MNIGQQTASDKTRVVGTNGPGGMVPSFSIRGGGDKRAGDFGRKFKLKMTIAEIRQRIMCDKKNHDHS